jgi:hypothetical protein
MALLSDSRLGCGSLERVADLPNVQLQTTWHGSRGVAVVVHKKPCAHPQSAKRSTQLAECDAPPFGRRCLENSAPLAMLLCGSQ